MRKLLMGMLGLGLTAAMAVPAFAYQPIVTGNIPFAFTAGDSQLPAGHYQIGEADITAPVLEIKNLDTGKSVFVPYVTRLAARAAGDSVVIFDVQGEHKYLSEVYAGIDDGYYIEGARGMHTHSTVKMSNARKAK